MSRNTPIPHISDEDKAFIRSLLIHKDDAVLAFNKPSGLPSNGKRPRLVHRLDAGTSGVIIAGKTKPAAAALAGAFEQRKAVKTYLAVIGGMLPDAERGTIDAPIARIETDRSANIVAGDKNGKQAVTHWRVMSRRDNKALLELRPETGRMHQLRVHLAYIGCPILGDRIYGNEASAPRLMLHAARLKLPHPDGGELKLETPAPESFNKTLHETD